MENTSSHIIEFTLLYNKHKRGLYNYALKMLSDKMTAEDLVQTVFLRLFENIKKIRNPESVTYWLYRTLRNEIYTIFRTKNGKVDQYNVDDSDEIEVQSVDNVELEYEAKELRHIIISELNKMNPAQKEVYILKEFGNLSYKEISEIMEIREELVKSRLFKTRRKLVEKISKLID